MILLAQLLNNRDLKFRGLFRTCVFLPCATALVSYSLIFNPLFATQGLINSILQGLHITSSNINLLGTAWTAKIYNALHPNELPPVLHTYIRVGLAQIGIGGDDTWGALVHPDRGENLKVERAGEAPLWRDE